MVQNVEVIIQPVTIRFSLYEDEVSYHFASHPKQQLDNMEKLMGVDVENSTLLSCNVGFLPVASITLIQGEKNILVDPGAHHVGSYGLLASALEQRGLSLEDIDVLAVTHWHHDHYSNLSLFKDKELVIGRGELDFGAEAVGQKEVDAKIHGIKKVSEVAPNQPLDIAKGVQAIYTPGHTPHSISVIVEDGEQTTGVVGDLAMTCQDFELKEFSHWYTKEQVQNSRKSLQDVMRYRPNKIIPGHDRAFSV